MDMDQYIDSRNLAFLLYEFLDTASLLTRPRYREQSRGTYDAVLDSARNIAGKYLAPHYQKGDAQEPAFEAGGVARTQQQSGPG